MNLTLYQLKTFWDVAKTGSLTRSAKNLGYSQSSVTTHIRAIENRVGAPLFYRLPHGVRLTTAGETFRVYVGKIFSVMDEMSTAMRSSGEATGRVVVGSTVLLMEYEMSELVRECRYRYPGVQVSPKVMAAAEIENAVAAGDIDIGLTLTTDPADEVPRIPGISRQSLFRVPLVPVGLSFSPSSPASLLPERPGPCVERVLVVDPDCAAQEVLLRHLKIEYGIDPPIMETGSTRSALSLAGAGLGVAMVPETAIDADLTRDGLTVLEDLPRTDTYVQALWAGSTWLSPAVSAFLELVRKARGTVAQTRTGVRTLQAEASLS